MTTHRPFVFVALFFSLGIVLQQYFSLVFLAGVFLTALALILSLFFVRHQFCFLIFLSLFFSGAGFIFSQSYQTTSGDHITSVARYYYGKAASLEGLVVSDVDQRSAWGGTKTTFVLEVKRIVAPWGWRKQSGKILVNIFRDCGVAYGDYILLEGKLHRPFEFSSGSKFSYEKYLSRKGIRYILSVKKISRAEVLSRGQGFWLKTVSLKTRDKFKAMFEKYFLPNEASLLITALLGDGAQIPKHIQELFVQTGTAHVLAISGFNIGIVTVVIFLFLRILPIGRKGQIVLTIVLLIFYAFLTGSKPPVVRATIMATVFLLSFLVQREIDAVNSLSLAAFLILLVNPLNIFDVGFQLSFISVLAIIQAYPLFWNFFTPLENRWAKPVLWTLKSFLVSLTAWGGVLGLIAYYFQVVTPISLLANLVVVPLSSVLVVLGLGFMLVGVTAPFLAFAFAACLKFVLNGMVGVIFLFAKIPWSYFYLKDVSLWYTISYYVFMSLLLGLWKIRQAKKITENQI